MDIIDRELTFVGLTPQPSRHELSENGRRKNLRPLGERPGAEPPLPSGTNNRRNCMAALMLITLAIFLGEQQQLTPEKVECNQYEQMGYSRNLIQSCMLTYRKYYNQIVYGRPDYCSPNMDTSKLYKELRHHQILHQETALYLLKAALRNNNTLNAIAIVGPSGVGKSMWARALAQHFPWPGNVHSYAWNTLVNDDVEKFHVLRLFAERLSDCGRNLLIIDNLTPCDREVVNIFNEMIATSIAESDADDKHVVVVYIFSLNTTDEDAVAAGHFQALQQLPGVTTVNFRALHREHLIDCVKRELDLAGLTLNSDDLNELIETIDVKRSGCKNVRAKVLAFDATKLR